MNLSAVNHWKIQRLSAFILIPLTIWFIISIILLSHSDYTQTVLWINSSLTQVLLSLFITISVLHAILGIEVVIEDYVKNPMRQRVIQLSKYLLFITALLSIYAIFHINIEIIKP